MERQKNSVASFRTGSTVMGYTEDGKIAYLDLSERERTWGDSCLYLPFQIEYFLKSKGTEIFGCTAGMQSVSCSKEKNAYTWKYLSQDGAVEVTVRQEFDCGVMAQTVEARNCSDSKLCIKQLYNFFNGLDSDCFADDYGERVRLGVIRGEWGGEGQLAWVRPDELGLVRTTGHQTRCTGEIRSSSAYTTRKVSPMLFLKDIVNGHVWFVQHLPDGPYCIEVGLTDEEHVPGSCFNVGCGAGRNDEHGFRLYLDSGESYTCAKTLIGCAENFDAAMQTLTDYRRAHLKKHPVAPLMFNDYMNCLWAQLDTPACLSLIDAAQRAGAEGYCFDDGWYRDRNAHGSAHLGDWSASEERFEGKSFAELIAEINGRGMVAGLWTELEVCSMMSEAAGFPDSWFLQNEGTRIFRCGRLYFNFSQPCVCEYLMERIKYIYGLGIRYIKNDYNGHPGCNVDWPNASGLAGAEQHCRAVHAFYARVREAFPDLKIENCGSGAMRADGHMMENFNIQSISDCEEYEKMPSIINGTLLSLLPEQVGIWAYPYPRIFWEMNGEGYLTQEYKEQMRDGRQTVFNLISGMMGNMYLSGKIDRADEYNFSLIRRGTELYKQLRDTIAQSAPVYPLGVASLRDEKSFVAQGLRNGNRLLMAVWRRQGEEEEVFLPISDAVAVKELFPGAGCSAKTADGGVCVRIPSVNQAVLLEIETEKTNQNR